MVEFLEPRIVLSSAATANLDDPQAAPPSMPALPTTPDPIIAYADGPYRAPHGQAIQPLTYDVGFGQTKLGGMVSLLDNDLGVITEFATGGLPTNVPATPGISSSTYSVTDGVNASNLAEVVLKSTNRAPEVYSWAFNLGANQSFGEHLALDRDLDPVTSSVSAALYGTPNVYGALNFLLEWYYTATSPASNVADRITITITDDVGAASTATLLMGLGLIDPMSRLDVHDDEATWGNLWEVATTGSVLRNDFIGGAGDWPGLWTATTNVVWNGTLPIGFTGNSDGSFSFMPPDIGAFMNGSPILISYTVTDSVGGSGTATLQINPKVLDPGESASGFGYSVTNGGLSNSGVITNGIAPIMAYPDFAGLTPAIQVVCGSLPSYIFSASGPESANAVLKTTSAGSLMISAYDLTIGNVSSSGLFRGTTNRDIGNVVADSIIVSAGGNVGTLTAAKRVVSAVAQGNIAGVSAGEHIVNVNAGVDLLGSVSAPNGRVGTVFVGRDILGSVIASREIESVTVARDVTGLVKSTNSSVYDVKVGRDLIGGANASLDVGTLFVGRDTLGVVSAGRDLYHVEIGRSIYSAVEAGHTIVTVKVADTVLGDVKAGTSGSGGIWSVTVDNDLVGDISAVNTIRSVMVGDELWGNVSSSAGSLWSLQAGNINSSAIYAYQNILAISASGTSTLSGNILAPMNLQADIGHIGTLSAANGINAAITAGTSIGEVQAASINPGLLAGSITAGTWIGPVRSDLGSISAVITADTSVNSVLAGQDITGDITATNLWIGDITATKGKISGKIKAKKDVGDITAGTNIEDDIESEDESLGDVTAGSYNAADSFLTGDGNITGAITALNGDIGTIRAHAILGGPMPSFSESDISTFQTAFDAWKSGPNPSPSTMPIPPRLPAPPASPAGDITQTITAGGHIAGVYAKGQIAGAITAGGSLLVVEAHKTIAGNITSGSGNLSVSTWGTLSGNVTGAADVTAFAYDPISGNVVSTSPAGKTSALSWDTISGTVNGPGGVSVGAWQNMAATIITQANAIVGSYHDVTGGINATEHVLVSAAGNVNSTITSNNADVQIAAIGNVGGNITAMTNVVASSFSSIAANVIATQGFAAYPFARSVTGTTIVKGSIYMNVLEGVSGSTTSTEGSILIIAKDISASVRADKGDIALDVYGNLSGAIVAGTPSNPGKVIAAIVRGSTSGNLTATGSVMLQSFEDVSGNITGAGTGSDPQVTTVVTWHDLSGSVNAGQGSVGVFAHDGISGTITGGGEVYAATWGAISAAVTGTGANQSVEVFARRDVSSNVTSAGSLTVTAGGDVSGLLQAGTSGSHNVSVSALGVGVGGATANGAVNGAVEAGGNATVYAKGDVTATVAGTTGNASVITRGGFQGSVTAGVDAILATGEAITSATVEAGRDANVSSHDAASSVNITADRNAELWAKGAISGSSVLASDFASGSYQPGTASVSSLTSLSSVTAKAGDDVSLYSGGLLTTGTGKSLQGSVTVSALGNLSGTFNAGINATLISLADIASSTVANAGTYSAGVLDLFAKSSLDGTYTVTGSAKATAMKNVNGTYTITTGGGTLFAGEVADAKVTADSVVVVNAGREIKNQLQSNNAAITAGVSAATGGGDISATIQAKTNATVTNLLGNVTGAITVTAGGADITADGQLSSTVATTGGNIVARLTKTISSSSLTASSAAIDLATLQDIASTVNANAGTTLTAWAGMNLGGTLTAVGNANVTSQTQNVTANVTSNTADVTVSALKTVSGPITANQNAVVHSLDGISGSVTATNGNATVVSLDNSISGAVSAGNSLTAFAKTDITSSLTTTAGDANVTAFGNLSGSVTAGQDAFITVGGSVTGSQSATRDINLSAMGSVSFPITGGQNATVAAFGPVTGLVQAATGNANVFSASNITGGVTAGNDASVFTGSGYSGLLQAGQDASVTALGSITMLNANAGRDASIVAFGLVSGAVTSAGRDVQVASLLSSNQVMVSSVGGNVSLFSDGFMNGFVSGVAGNIDATSFGILQGSFSATDVSVYAVGSIPTINVNASDEASVVTWGTATGPATVSGTNSATLWAASDINGSVTSSAGSAVAISFGNIISVGGITGGTDAVALAVGYFSGSVTATDFAGLVTLGDFISGSVSGNDAIALTQGNLNGSVNATNDAAALAIGDFGGSVFAGNDATVASYGSFLSSASVTANRDITDIWAVGDINGSFTAVRNIGATWTSEDGLSSTTGGILSYGSINATFTATGTTGDSSTGNIANATTVGSIAGSFTAGTSVGDLTAGSAITATTPGNIFAFDSTLAGTTAPPIPASITSDVLLALGTARSLMNQSVSDYFTAATQAQTDASTALTNAQNDAINAMGTALTDLTNSNIQLRSDAKYEFDGSGNPNSTVATTNDSYNNARNAAFVQWNGVLADAIDMATAANGANNAAINHSTIAVNDLDTAFAASGETLTNADFDFVTIVGQLPIGIAAQLANHVVDWNNAALRRFQQTQIATGGAFQEPGFWDDYFRYLLHPSDMDDDLESEFYGWLTVAGVSGGLALGLGGLSVAGITTLGTESMSALFLSAVIEGAPPAVVPAATAAAQIFARGGPTAFIAVTGAFASNSQPNAIPRPIQARSAIQAQNLSRQLTSEEQVGQALMGKGEALIGAGTNKELLAANRLATEYGGKASDWAKMGGQSSATRGIQTPGGENFEIHWYQNVQTGMIAELKTKIAGH